MSEATKRKHVKREVLEEFVIPEPNQIIAKISSGRGNNFHDVITEDGKSFIASMPRKFRKSVWIKRGDYVILDPILEGNKVKGEIVHILYPQQIQYLKDEQLWPTCFTMTPGEEGGVTGEEGGVTGKEGGVTGEEGGVTGEEQRHSEIEEESSSEEDSLEALLGPNPNHPPTLVISDGDSN